jgi:ATP-binding cassette, subfamily B, bacterial
MKGRFKFFIESLKLVWRSSPRWTLANIAVSVIRSFLPLVLIWLLKLVVDSITTATMTGPGTPVSAILWPVTFLALVWLVDEAADDLGNYIRKKQSMKLEIYMFGLLHTKAIKLDLINFENPEFFDCLTRAAREAPWRPNSILNNVIGLFRGGLSLVVITGLIITLHWGFAILLLVANLPGLLMRIRYSDILYNFQKNQTPEARKSAYYNWLLTGDRPSRELRLFGLGKYFKSLFMDSFLKQKDEELNILRKRTYVELISVFFKALSFFVVMLFIAHQTILGRLSLGQMAMFLMAFRQGMIYIKEIAGSMAGLYEDNLFISDTFQFLNLEEKVKAFEPVIQVSPLKDKIRIQNLSFKYPGNEKKTIDNVSFEIKKGEIIALVGPNGAGKSTLARLLCRLYDPDSGTISYDGNDIKHLIPEDYLKHFSVVFQDFMLYNLTAGENIRLGNIETENSKDLIQKAASDSGVHRLVSSLPDGYDTLIGNLFEESRELSWGEWQKLSIARALFRDASVLILDEPSSALDTDTEFEIFNKFREIVNGRTSILITHRLTNISLADRIIVLEDGAIAESGTHEELMKRGGIYHSLFTKQSSRFTAKD